MCHILTGEEEGGPLKSTREGGLLSSKVMYNCSCSSVAMAQAGPPNGVMDLRKFNLKRLTY